MTIEQKLPEWWDMFCEAFKTQTLDEYECRHVEYASRVLDGERVDSFRNPVIYLGSIATNPQDWEFRKRVRTVRIEIDGQWVELAAPVLAGDVVPRNAIVWAIGTRKKIVANAVLHDVLVSLDVRTCDMVRDALLGVKP